MIEDNKFQIEKIIGISDEDASCGVFTKKVTLFDKSVANVISVICIYKMLPKDAGEHLRQIFELTCERLEESEGSVLEILKNAREKSESYVQSLNIEVSFVNVAFYKNACYLVRLGDKVKVEVFEADKSHQLKIQDGSGPVRNKQIYIFGTEKFFSTFDVDSLSGVEGDINLEEIIDGLATEISAVDKQSEIAAAIVKAAITEGTEKKSAITDDTDKKKDDTEGGEGESQRVKTKEKREGQEDLEGESQTEEEMMSDNLTAVEARSEVEEENMFRQVPKKRRIDLWRVASGAVSSVFLELAKLRKGDLGAILRLRRNVFLIAVVCVVILAVSAYFTISSSKNRKDQEAFSTYFASATSKYNEGVALVEFNKNKAREVLIEAQNDADKAIEIDGDEKRATELKSKIIQALGSIESRANLEFRTLQDLESRIQSLSSFDGRLVAVGDGKVSVIDGEDVSEFEGPNSPSHAISYSNNVFVSADGKIFKVDLAKEETAEIGTAANVGDIDVFFGNIYTLSPDKILKFVPIESGYAEGASYLESTESFTNSSKFTIDGSVWVTKGGEIKKYTRGVAEEFKISGLTQAASEFGEIYTTGDLDNLYVFDIKNSAILVFSKDGVYQKSLQSDEFSKMSGFVVASDEAKIYVAVDDKVLEASI